jgi:hypothetical protein
VKDDKKGGIREYRLQLLPRLEIDGVLVDEAVTSVAHVQLPIGRPAAAPFIDGHAFPMTAVVSAPTRLSSSSSSSSSSSLSSSSSSSHGATITWIVGSQALIGPPTTLSFREEDDLGTEASVVSSGDDLIRSICSDGFKFVVVSSVRMFPLSSAASTMCMYVCVSVCHRVLCDRSKPQ